MKEFTDLIYKALYEHLSLQTAGIVVGLAVIVIHALALVKGPAAMEKLKTVPRSQNLGTIFLTIDFVWAWVVASSMELGDFERLRWLALFSVPVIYVAMLFWVNDYLGARAIGIFLLLAPCPALDAAFLKATDARVILSILCYVWITLGLFWIGMPYTMRNQIAWVTRTAGRFKGFAAAGLAYGVLLTVIAFTAYKGM
ncbi:MAG TPA: hypothetical protein VHM91_13955 [Verrucomicrobiales bacterium]|jgi:hypothetical protein|nr:hypothetical protein [Verrucomicrobiales bacterium]